jgi:hypothetical protein
MLLLINTFLSTAATVFFTAWMVLIAAVGISAFGRDLLPSRAHLQSPGPHRQVSSDKH